LLAIYIPVFYPPKGERFFIVVDFMDAVLSEEDAFLGFSSSVFPTFKANVLRFLSSVTF
jgi:hypothetical protein